MYIIGTYLDNLPFFVFQILLNLVGVIVVILMTDVTLLIPTAAALIIFYLFRVIYIRTTGAVKRLEGISIYLPKNNLVSDYSKKFKKSIDLLIGSSQPGLQSPQRHGPRPSHRSLVWR